APGKDRAVSVTLTLRLARHSIARYERRDAQGPPRHARPGGRAGAAGARVRRHRGAATAERGRLRPAGGDGLPGAPPARARRAAGQRLVDRRAAPAARLPAERARSGRACRSRARLAALLAGRGGRAGGEAGVIEDYLARLERRLCLAAPEKARVVDEL